MLEKEGFRFDMGPSWYLMPDVFERFFNRLGTSTGELFSLSRLEPAYRVFFDNNDVVDISTELEKNLALFDRLEPNGASKLTRYLALAKAQYDVSLEHVVLNKPAFSTFFDPSVLKAARQLKLLGSLSALIDRFFSDDRAKKILQYRIVFLGGNPDNTPAIYSLILNSISTWASGTPRVVWARFGMPFFQRRKIWAFGLSSTRRSRRSRLKTAIPTACSPSRGFIPQTRW